MLQCLENMKSMLKRELKSDAWQEELQAKMSKIYLQNRRASELLDAMEAVRTQRTEGTGGVRSLAEARQIKKDRVRIAQLRKELAEGDPAVIKGYNDRDLEFLAEDERRWRTELSQTAARIQMNMLRDRILKELAGLISKQSKDNKKSTANRWVFNSFERVGQIVEIMQMQVEQMPEMVSVFRSAEEVAGSKIG